MNAKRFNNAEDRQPINYNERDFRVRHPMSFKRILGWSGWVEIDSESYSSLLQLLRVSVDYKPAQTYTPYPLAPKEYRSCGQFIEDEWDTGAIVPDVFTRQNGEKWDYVHRPGPTKIFLMVRRNRRGVSVEVMKRGKTITSAVEAFNHFTNRWVSVAMPNIKVEFRHRATLPQLPDSLRWLF